MNNTKCYFCQQTLQNQNIEAHAAQCKYVLEPCTKKCGAYIPRYMKTQHLQTCRNSTMKTSRSHENLLEEQIYGTYPRAANSNNYYQTNSFPRRQNQTQYQSQMSLVSNIDPNEIKYVDLKSKFYQSHQQHSDLIRQIEKSLNNVRMQVQLVQSQNQTLVDWRTNVQFQIDGLMNELRQFQASNKNDVNACRLQETMKNISHLRDLVNNQQVTFKTQQVELGQFQNDIQRKLNEVQVFFGHEIKCISNLTQDQKEQIDSLTKENTGFLKVNTELQEEVKELKKELTSLKTVYEKMTENEKLQEAKVTELKRSLAEISLNVEVTEHSFQNIQGLIATQQGRLIWKISDFNLKLENAKANNKMALKSPIFFTADYGYRIRIVAYLNGLKKWRGRHLLASLHVLKGDYDDMLKWPCKIEANILLKDLEYSEKPKDYVRYITAKRNFPEDIADDPQESSTEFIFIPHTTLFKSNYTKNDTIFLEIIVNNQ